MKKIIILFILLFAVSYTQIKAQDDAQFPDVSGKITDNNEKLSLNTGAVSMSVPIWTAEQYGLSIPISVSFNGNGIKKNELNSLFGPWNLNVGGLINVEQRGLYDREDGGSAILGKGFCYSGSYVVDNVGGINSSFVLHAVHKDENSGKFSDTEPDIFYYNFPGGSGKFVYNNSGQLVNLTDKSLKISYLTNSSGITDDEIYITNNNGIKYYFKCTGYIEDEEGIKSSPVFSLYKADDLNSVNILEISFQPTYTSYSQSVNNKALYTYHCDEDLSFSSNGSSSYTTYRKYPETIETNTSKIEFIFSDENSDWDGFYNVTVSLKRKNVFKPYFRYRFLKTNYSGKEILSRIIKEYNTNYNSDNSEIIWESNDNGYAFGYRGIPVGGTDFWGYNNGKINDIENLETYQSSESSVLHLKKISFPNKSSLEYEFKLNKFSSQLGFSHTRGAGLKVTKITEKDEHNKITSVTEYDYGGDGLEDESGKLTTPPYPTNSFYFTVQAVDNFTGHLYTQSSSPFMLGNSYVNYSEVTEYIGGKDGDTGNGKNGRIDYFFKNETSEVFDNFSDETNIKELFGNLGVFDDPDVYKFFSDDIGMYASFEYKFPYKLHVDKADINGLLEKKTIFDNLNKKISETEYQYDISEKYVSTGLKVYDYLPATSCWTIGADEVTWYHGITFYKLSEYKVKLTKETTRLFDKNDETKVNESQTTFEYSENTDGDLIINMPIKKQTVLSNGDTVTIRDYFPHNYNGQSDILTLMNVRNIKTELIKSETYKNNELLSAQQTQYRKKLLNISPNLTREVIVPGLSQIWEDGEFKTVKWFDKYDDKIRLTESHGIDSIHNSVIYNTLGVPIAKVINAGSNQIYHTSFEETEGNYSLSTYNGRKAHEGSYQFTLPETAGTYTLNYRKFADGKWNYVSSEITNPGNGSNYTVNDGIIDELRVYPTDALMTTNTSEIGIGMTSQTDANGISIYMEYDKFNRIAKLYNQDKKIIKKYDYNRASEELYMLPLSYTVEPFEDRFKVKVSATVSGGSLPYQFSWDGEGLENPIYSDDMSEIIFFCDVGTYHIYCQLTDNLNNTITKTITVEIQN